MQGVREGILGCSLAERGEPGVWNRVVHHMHTMLVEGVAMPQHGHHVQQGKLVLMEHCWSWQGAREQVYSWGRGVGMKALESLEGGTAVKGENFKFTG